MAELVAESSVQCSALLTDNCLRAPMKPTPNDYAEARKLLSPPVFFGGTAAGYQHDHDEEMGTWDKHPCPNTRTVAAVMSVFRRKGP